jgi:polysaccharide export outer membrane protein
VIGAVNQQGAIAFSSLDKPIMLDAIARAGGFGPRADRNAVRVIRQNPDGSRANLTLTEPELMRGTGQIGVLQRGDIVVVSEKSEPVVRGQVTIGGQIRFPGRINIVAGTKLTVVEAIQKAGGPSQTADLRRVRLTRVGPQSRQLVQHIVDVSVFFAGGASSGTSFELEPEDLVYVPERIL